MSYTLVINSDGQPLSQIPISSLHWQDAIKVEWLNRADVLSVYKNWIVRSPNVCMEVPTVLMARSYIKVKRTVKLSRYHIYLRDLFKCMYCGYCGEKDQATLTLDHVKPKYENGQSTWTNLTTACNECNIKKAHYHKLKPIKAPYEPSYWELLEKRKQYPIAVPHRDWVPWLDWKEDLIYLKKIKY